MLRGILRRDIDALGAMAPDELLNARYERFRKLGVYKTAEISG
jgi:acetyl-CoA carboxylase alpha subunit